MLGTRAVSEKLTLVDSYMLIKVFDEPQDAEKFLNLGLHNLFGGLSAASAPRIDIIVCHF